MEHLSRVEELILLAVWKTGKNAYCVSIREKVSEMEGREWSFGAIYFPLHRLESKGYLTSYMGEPSKERGGRSKRFYQLTKHGTESLSRVRQLNTRMWEGVPDLSGE